MNANVNFKFRVDARRIRGYHYMGDSFPFSSLIREVAKHGRRWKMYVDGRRASRRAFIAAPLIFKAGLLSSLQRFDRHRSGVACFLKTGG